MQRTPETFEKHLLRIQSCSKKFVLLKNLSTLNSEYLVCPVRCGSNYCLRCRSLNLVQLRQSLQKSLSKYTWRLVTLTFAQRIVSITDRLKTLHKTFDLFLKRIRRRFPDLAFAKSVEVHQTGYPHIHMIINSYVPIAFLQLCWSAVGGGFVKIRKKIFCSKHQCYNCNLCRHKYVSSNHLTAAKYLTEELEKTMQDPHNLGLEFWLSGRRSFSTSRNIKLEASSSHYSFLKIFDSALSLQIALLNDFSNYNISNSSSRLIISNFVKNTCAIADANFINELLAKV